MSFTELNLHPALNKAITACGYTQPTPVQAQSIPNILLGKDLIAVAQTGTGKTAAFILPALHKLHSGNESKKAKILVLTPTRELAKQIMDAARLYGKFMKLNVVSLVGGTPYHHQIRDLSRPIDIIVATPGRLLDHIKAKRVDLSHVEMLVLDEADRMLDMGFIDDVKDIARGTPANRQTLLFTATITHRLSTVIKQLLKNPTEINLSNEKISPKDIKQALYLADNHQHKMRLLQHLLDNEGMYKAIIFSSTKINTDRLSDDLREQGYEASALHGDLRQNVRNRTLEQLRKGKIQYLVATDVAARGIDVSDITHVINFDLPKFAEDYVHRIGRTGRAGKSGVAISLALKQDLRLVQKIERYLGHKIKQETVEGLEPKQGGGFSSGKPNHGHQRDGRKRRDNRPYHHEGRKKRAEGEYRGNSRRQEEGEYRGKGRRQTEGGEYRGNDRKRREGEYRGNDRRRGENEYRGNDRKQAEGEYRGNDRKRGESESRGNDRKRIAGEYRRSDKKQVKNEYRRGDRKQAEGAARRNENHTESKRFREEDARVIFKKKRRNEW